MVKENEKVLICALSRIKMEEKDILCVQEALVKEIDWEYIFNVTYKNKIHLLVFKNLEQFEISDKSYLKYSSIVQQLGYVNRLKIENKYAELEKLVNQVKGKIEIVPVKGAYLIDELYKDYSIRSTNDFDLLIRKCDVPEIDKELKNLGYVQGKYNKQTKSIEKFKADMKMLYKTKLYNLLPYRKKFEEDVFECMVFDISHSLDYSLDGRPVDEMISNANNNEGKLTLKPEHFFIHLCCHHYREASHASWIMMGKDLNLIKFCDVREFIINKMNEDNIEAAINFAKKYDLEKAVYFTIYFVKEIYNDGYEDKILDKLEIDDLEFLYQYGENEFDEIKTRKKDFWTSLFSETNIDEITEKPKYNGIVEL